MATFREAVGVATKSAICTVLAGAEASSYVSRIGFPAPGSQTVINTVRSARRAVCDNTDSAVDTPDPPAFSGGQCPGVEYQVSGTRVKYTSKECFGSGDIEETDRDSPFTVTVFGPIEALTIEDIRVDDCGVKERAIFLEAYDAQGNPENFPIWSFDFSLFAVVSQELTIDSITRTDGLPDECGDPPPPPIPPYSPVTIKRDVTYNDNSETEITEEGDFTINAPVLIGGNIIAPVSIDLGGVEIPVELNLSTGDITFDFEGGDTPAPTADGDDDVPSPDDEPDIEENSLIYGLIVYSTPTTGEGSVTSEIAQGDAPTLLLPRTGNVWFQVPVGDRISWMGPIPVQSQNQLVLVPGGLAASGYRLFPNTGWQLSGVRMEKPPCGCVSG